MSSDLYKSLRNNITQKKISTDNCTDSKNMYYSSDKHISLQDTPSQLMTKISSNGHYYSLLSLDISDIDNKDDNDNLYLNYSSENEYLDLNLELDQNYSNKKDSINGYVRNSFETNHDVIKEISESYQSSKYDNQQIDDHYKLSSNSVKLLNDEFDYLGMMFDFEMDGMFYINILLDVKYIGSIINLILKIYLVILFIVEIVSFILRTYIPIFRKLHQKYGIFNIIFFIFISIYLFNFLKLKKPIRNKAKDKINLKYNYANIDSGALIVDYENVDNIKNIIKTAENYSSLSCDEKSYVIIQLSRDIYIENISIEINQYFSSKLEKFRVYYANRYNKISKNSNRLSLPVNDYEFYPLYQNYTEDKYGNIINTFPVNEYGKTNFDKFRNHWVKYLYIEFEEWHLNPYSNCIISAIEVYGKPAENVGFKSNEIVKITDVNDNETVIKGSIDPFSSRDFTKNYNIYENFISYTQRTEIKNEIKKEIELEMHPIHTLEIDLEILKQKLKLMNERQQNVDKNKYSLSFIVIVIVIIVITNFAVTYLVIYHVLSVKVKKNCDKEIEIKLEINNNNDYSSENNTDNLQLKPSYNTLYENNNNNIKSNQIENNNNKIPDQNICIDFNNALPIHDNYLSNNNPNDYCSNSNFNTSHGQLNYAQIIPNIYDRTIMSESNIAYNNIEYNYNTDTNTKLNRNTNRHRNVYEFNNSSLNSTIELKLYDAYIQSSMNDNNNSSYSKSFKREMSKENLIYNMLTEKNINIKDSSDIEILLKETVKNGFMDK